MSKVTERANELYPNSKSFCGGVASIARDAYIKGVQETIDLGVEWIKIRELCIDKDMCDPQIYINAFRQAMETRNVSLK